MGNLTASRKEVKFKSRRCNQIRGAGIELVRFYEEDALVKTLNPVSNSNISQLLLSKPELYNDCGRHFDLDGPFA